MKSVQVSQTRQRPPFRADDVSCLLSVTDTPDGAVAVFTEKQRAVFRHSNPDRPTPDTAIARHEAGNEIVVFAEHFAGRVIKRHTHDFIPSAPRTIPGAMECGEDIAFVFGWKLLAGVKTKIECRRVRLHENVGHNNFARKIDPPVRRLDESVLWRIG